MSSLLQSQLENERAIYTSMKAQARNDYIARLVLNRIEQQINRLQRRVDNGQKDREERRQESIKHGYAVTTPQLPKKAFGGYWIVYVFNCYSMLRRASGIMQAQGIK